MAEDLLDTIGQLFGPIRGGLAYAVILVGAMLAATTGVVAASVISMGLISLPIMLRYGYDRRLASRRHRRVGHAGADHPAVARADHPGRPARPQRRRHVQGRLHPGLRADRPVRRSTSLVVSLFRPHWAPALPPEARTIREADGTRACRSLGVLFVLSVAAGDRVRASTRPDDRRRPTS